MPRNLQFLTCQRLPWAVAPVRRGHKVIPAPGVELREGRGYATEAASAVLRAAMATGRRRLWATVRSWNAPSLRVLDKLGFETDHVSTDGRGELAWLTRSLV